MRYVLVLVLVAGLLVGCGATDQAGGEPTPTAFSVVTTGPTPTPTACEAFGGPHHCGTPPPSFCPGAISWDEASRYVGTQKSVWGPVATVSLEGGGVVDGHAPGLRTVLTLGQPYPNQKFRVLIKSSGADAPEQTYRGQTICVTGLIETYQSPRESIPQIEATRPSQIEIYSPVTQPPITQPPVTQPPVTQPPVTQPPPPPPTRIPSAPPPFWPGAISWDEASQYVGSQKSVKGPVASTTYASKTKGQPTFLNLGQPYPNHKFTVLIWGSNRSNFPGDPEQTYRGRTICVTGLIETYQGKPQIEATTPSQIVIAP